MAHHEAVLRAYGLTMTQYTVLLIISREGGMSGAQLARSCGVTQQSMGSVLTNMENKELIRRETSPVHAKVQIATLTAEGQALLDRAYQEVIILERALTDAFTPSEHTALCELLERATTVLIQQTRHATAPPPPEPAATLFRCSVVPSVAGVAGVPGGRTEHPRAVVLGPRGGPRPDDHQDGDGGPQQVEDPGEHREPYGRRTVHRPLRGRAFLGRAYLDGPRLEVRLPGPPPPGPPPPGVHLPGSRSAGAAPERRGPRPRARSARWTRSARCRRARPCRSPWRTRRRGRRRPPRRTPGRCGAAAAWWRARPRRPALRASCARPAGTCSRRR